MTLPTPGMDTARDALGRIARLADPARARRIGALRRLWRGLPEDGLASFWDGSVPLNERAPCVASGLPEAAGNRLTALVFGEGRFPTLTLRDRDPYGRVWDEGQRAALARLAVEVIDAAALRSLMPRALGEGLEASTVVLVASLRRGRPSVEMLPAEWCEPERDPDGEVIALEQRYRYTEGGSAFWYRRRIDSERDVTYRPAPVDDEGREPAWVEDPARTVEHRLGFCPAIWHRNRPAVGECGEDGTALFDGLDDELHALDMALSQHHRAGRYNGDPQMWADDADDETPMRAPVGREADPPIPGFSWLNTVVSGFRTRGGGSAMAKSPTKVWHLAKGSSLNLAESSGAGASILREDAKQLRQAILDARGIVITTPSDLGANASARLLREVHAAMVAQAGLYREEYGSLLCALVDLLLRVCLVVRQRGDGVYLAWLSEALPALVAAQVSLGGTASWTPLPWSLTWGDYFEPTWSDVTSAVTAATQALQAGVVTVDEARRLLAPVLGIDASEAAEELAADARDRQAAVRGALAGLGARPED